MTTMKVDQSEAVLANQEQWLKLYYFIRAAFSVSWVVAALTVGQSFPPIAGILLIAYPAWDAAANFLDATRSGGLNQNRTQVLNVMVSLVTTLVIIVALQMSMNRVLGVFGAWAILAGLLQLGTAIRRWRSYGAQWAMVLSGGQSALAGGFFIVQAVAPVSPSIANLAGYAGVGALYFLVSGVWLSVKEWRRAGGA
jgi:ABC-type uncharacterized transport system permease subunit